MKKILSLLCALMLLAIGSSAQDTNLCTADGVTAKIGETDVANILNGTGAQPNSYNDNSEMNIVVNLGSSKTIDGFSITFSGDRWVSEFTLSYSTDGSSYTKIADYSTGISSNTTTTIAQAFASQVTAQYIKYTSKKNNKNETGDTYSETIKNFQLIQYATGTTVPPTHNDMYEEIFTKNYTSTVWQLAWNGGATDGGVASYGGMPVKSLTAVGAVHFGKTSDTQDFTANAALYNKLSVDIYVESATSDYQFNFDNGGYTQDITLNAGWNTATVTITGDAATHLKILSIRCKNNDTKVAMKLANIYFSEASEDVNNYVITSLSASPSIIKKNTATAITFSPKNANGTDLTTYGDSKVTVAYAITSGTGTLSDGTLTITGDDPVVITATATRVSDSHESTATTTINLYPAAPAVPTENSENVVAVYSETYSATSPSYATSGWGTPACTFSSKEEIDLGTSNKALHVVGDGIGFGISFTAEGTKLSDYAEVYFDIYPANAVTSGKVFVEQDAQSFADFTATAGSWQTKHFTFTASSDKASYLFISLGAGATNDFLLDNIYFVKKNNTAVYIGEESNGVVTVTGTVTSENKSTVEAITAKVIDMRGATLSGVTGITLKDNQLIIAKAESATNESKASAMADALTGNTSNVIITDGTYYWAMKPIVYTDQNERQPVSFSINTLTQGYTITRSIPVGKYITAAPMAAVTAPEGIDVYEFTAYDAGSVTFTKKASREMSAKTPYVLYNTTGAAINLVVSGTGDLNPTVDAVTVTQNSANFVANLTELTTNGTQYVLSEGQIKKGNGVKVGAYRAYFTGVSVPNGGSVKAMFGDVETSIDTAGGEITRQPTVVYDLNGRRVKNATKGVYIVNGKLKYIM